MMFKSLFQHQFSGGTFSHSRNERTNQLTGNCLKLQLCCQTSFFFCVCVHFLSPHKKMLNDTVDVENEKICKGMLDFYLFIYVLLTSSANPV